MKNAIIHVVLLEKIEEWAISFRNVSVIKNCVVGCKDDVMIIKSFNDITKVINRIFNIYNRKKYICNDPLIFLYRYKDIRDREIVALVSSSLAYGRVNQIFKSVSSILEMIGPSPYKFVLQNTYVSMLKKFRGFKHRFNDGSHVAALLFGVKKILYRFGSLNNCFKTGFTNTYGDIFLSLNYFVENINSSIFNVGHLLADPKKKSACKRLNLFLRWMIRKDNVDIGGWSGIPTSFLIIPLDVHMHNIGKILNFTTRRSSDMKTAFEITSKFKLISVNDPVKYDFALTRLGILKESKLSDFL